MTVLRFCVAESLSIRQVMLRIDKEARGLVLVTREQQGLHFLTGMVTDGDVRRWILQKGDFDSPVSQIMNIRPLTLSLAERYRAPQLMRQERVEAIPLLGSSGELLDICFWDEHFTEHPWQNTQLDVPVVIMAGGRGTRLHPYTHVLPKPLVPIAEIPIAQRIINQYRAFGCRRFYITVNHKKEMIRAYFDSVAKDYELTYIEEPEPLGTAGSLNLLQGKIKQEFFVNNCDIIVEADYAKIYESHIKQGVPLTMVTCSRTETVPYGVIDLDTEGRIEKIREKPQYDFLVNTGMYVMSPQVLADIPKNRFFHITELIEDYSRNRKAVATFPISSQSWYDMGNHEELRRMEEYFRV